MWSPPVLLSLSTIFALVGFVLVVLAGFTDNWLDYQVDRKELGVQKSELESGKYGKHLNADMLFYSRSQGLTHVCFPELVPSSIGSFSKFGSVCITNQDYWPDVNQMQRFNSAQFQRLWMLRAMLSLFLLGLLVSVLALCVGVIGCYRSSAKLVGWTAMLFLLSVVFLIFAMLLWHYVNYLDRKVLDVPPYYLDWPKVLKAVTRISFGWSYIVCWLGIGFLAFTVFLLWLSRRAIRDEKNSMYEQKHAQYFQHYYGAQSDKSLVPLAPAAAGGMGTLPPYYGTYGYGGYPPGAYYGQYASPYALYGAGYYGHL